jgi:CDP-diacylglycerol--serine O-phosphatidyltransferase
MMTITRHIPNMLTCGNLLLGALGTYMAISGRPELTVWAVLLAAVLDFFDGFAARLLKAYSAIGKDLDSLADLVSFGVAPAAVLSSMLHYHFVGTWGGEFMNLETRQQFILLCPFLLAAFAAVRLAKFNNDSRQTENFIGLTTTATAMFVVSLFYLVVSRGGAWLAFTSPLYVLILVAVFCALLVSEIPMFSLKFKSFEWKGNENRYILLIISLVAVILLGAGALALIVPVYVLYSAVLMLGCKLSTKA